MVNNFLNKRCIQMHKSCKLGPSVKMVIAINKTNAKNHRKLPKKAENTSHS